MPQVKSPLPYRLHNEDCFATFNRLGAGTVDLVLCDPPYGTTASAWDSVIPLGEMWGEVERVLSQNGSAIFTSSQPFTTTLIGSNLPRFKYSMVWVKTRSVGFVNVRYRPLKSHEDVCVFSKGGCSEGSKFPMTYIPQMGKGDRYRSYKNGVSECGTSTVRSKMSRIDGDYGPERYPKSHFEFGSDVGLHPNQKPLALMSYLLKTYSNPGDTGLDFAMGSGTTGVACMVHGRKFVGCDSDTSNGYFDTAELRIKTAYRQNWGKQRAESA